MTVKELVYIILDLAKAATSDDSFYTEEHVIFLCKKYRSFLLNKEKEKNKGISDSFSDMEMQQLCLDLEKATFFNGTPCVGNCYLRSVNPIPKIIEGSIPKIYPIDYYQGTHINYVSKDKMRYVGTNKYLHNIIYASLGPDYHLYLTSSNHQFKYLKKLHISAVFEDFDSVELSNEEANDDVLDMVFPIREHLVPPLIELVVKELVGAAYRPADTNNNASDDLSDIIAWVRRNMKNSIQKQIEG